MTDEYLEEATTELEPSQVQTVETRNSRRALALGAGFVIVILIAANVMLWLRLQDTRDDLHTTRQQLGLVSNSGARSSSTLASQLEDLSTRTDDLESQVGDAGSIDDIGTRIDDLQTAIDDLTSCVDDFQRAVDSGGRYLFCG